MSEKERGRPTGPGAAPLGITRDQPMSDLATESISSVDLEDQAATPGGWTRPLTEEGLLSPVYVLGTQDPDPRRVWDDIPEDVEQAPSRGFVFDLENDREDITERVMSKAVVLITETISEITGRKVPTFKAPIVAFDLGHDPGDPEVYLAEVQGHHVAGILRGIISADDPEPYVTGAFADVLVSDDDQTRRELGLVQLDDLQDARTHHALQEWISGQKAQMDRRKEAEEKARLDQEAERAERINAYVLANLDAAKAREKLRLRAQREARRELDQEEGLATDYVASPRAAGLGSWLAVQEEEPEPIWGTRELPLWVPGESLMLVGPPSVGKSTMAHLLVWGLLGLKPDVLGFPVKAPAEDGGILYLAMDRPAQIRRAMQRLIRTHGGDSPELMEHLDQRVTIWEGPLPADITLPANQRYLVAMAKHYGRTTIVVDSTKDVLPNASDEAKAGGYNMARQEALAEGLNWLELHHNRKANGESKEPNTLDDVYGSRWLTAGAGSVLSLYGQPGDIVVKLTHVKPLGEPLFPKHVRLDRETGGMALYEEMTPELALLEAGPQGAPIKDLAGVLFDTKNPTKSQVENTRNKINRLIKEGKAAEIAGSPTRYRAAGSGLEFNPGADPFDTP